MAKTQIGTGNVEQTVEGFAEDLGRVLAAARTKAEDWIGQRQNVAKQLTQISDTAGDLLRQIIGDGAGRTNAVRRRGRRPKQVQAARATAAPRRRRKLSAKARRAISLAQKRRWAKVKAAQK